MLDYAGRMVTFCVDIQWLAVRLSVGVVRSVVEIKCDVEVVNDFQVRLYGDVKSVVLEVSSDGLCDSFGLWS